MRRMIFEEPVSRAAIWSSRLALLALPVTLLAAVLVRVERVEIEPGLVAVASGVALAVLAALLALVAFARIWTHGHGGFGAALLALLLSGAILAYPAYLGMHALTLPALSDVSTDLIEPPAFSRSPAVLAARGEAVPPTPLLASREVQRRAYPRIASLTLDVPAEDAFSLASRAADARGWTILETQAPGGPTQAGRIEGVARTLVLRLPIDVTVRIRPIGEGSRIDVRSATRHGFHDLGVNAAVIRLYLDEVTGLALAL